MDERNSIGTNTFEYIKYIRRPIHNKIYQFHASQFKIFTESHGINLTKQ